ncbi:hypothetical protein RO3G_07528 [Rhizopus delemar RA 99-880]|uniref:Uncharacterized protein n=1 Tax=Rhizopus delemar (strain RA 99-880 / ATCC MYA-4621 / FGSC 9543 / NRRL 43880) TaxID=246409 RepID=I1C2Z3_RHIO9|nr:hypothetical protein RO3G_07528 [Rhizopus delemar RA 99-880]|eukprot:EIE82823.1 hypothetical protein RO3G_07528 [Rhizopus delemar RA 99-880]
MKLLLLVQFACFIHVIHSFIVQPPQPTKTAGIIDGQRRIEYPTIAPDKRHVKRDLADTLSLYENWAHDCNNQKNNVKVAVSNLNGLWQTVTSTVYCGNGQVVTVTKTVTAKPSSTATLTSTTTKGSTQKLSSMLDTYGYGISVAQGITGTILALLGIYFLIFGFSSFRGTLAATGFVFFVSQFILLAVSVGFSLLFSYFHGKKALQFKSKWHVFALL